MGDGSIETRINEGDKRSRLVVDVKEGLGY